MTYKNYLQNRITEIESRILSGLYDKEALEKELNILKLAEFQETLKESQNSTQQLLKG